MQLTLPFARELADYRLRDRRWCVAMVVGSAVLELIRAVNHLLCLSLQPGVGGGGWWLSLLPWGRSGPDHRGLGARRPLPCALLRRRGLGLQWEKGFEVGAGRP